MEIEYTANAHASGGFGLAVGLVIQAPNVPADRHAELTQATDQNCAYSNATSGNIVVTRTRTVARVE
ncbi:MAG: hypothetical protein LH475_02245 [Cryobacterium sp.]|uniref:hypothetical protein n=1 Tax=Cryobacterium sp. TaxID=1926290 RepID=UPI00228D76F2|nr:hypothetical protein [Cryobacterium sp.]MCY7403451.1 hypothetical protein [Cryobacterium sp.]